MKKKITKDQIKVSDVSSKSFKGSIVGVALFSALALTSCSDDKSCTDADKSADGNGSTRYDLGVYQDNADFGGDTDRGVGDSPGNGDLCSDYD